MAPAAQDRAKHIAEQLGVSTSVALGPDGGPVLEAGEEVTSTCSPVGLVFGDSVDAGAGTLYITSRWAAEEGP